MLYTAIQDVMVKREDKPKALISKSGAWVWRSFRIDDYGELARGQYYFQISPNDDKILYSEDDELNHIKGTIQKHGLSYTPHTLIFKESYIEQDYKPSDPMEEQYGLKSGTYHDPFWITLDLYKSRFFLLNVDEQYSQLHDFIDFAIGQAKLWQNSEARKRETLEKFVNGAKPDRHPRGAPKGFDQVTPEFLTALRSQAFLFKKLWDVLYERLGENIQWLWPNAHWRNWDFRGLRLKVKDLSQKLHADYLWSIYYEYDKKDSFRRPDRLACFSYDGKNRTGISYLDINEKNLFDLQDERQTEEIRAFVERVFSNQGI